ncbi:hypothetical protein BGZ51_002754 [Haplosporangium sp. Z 767]|nr:hypothetical protein BGZ51_002754 [Haplosporangium sp. Z 767]
MDYRSTSPPSYGLGPLLSYIIGWAYFAAWSASFYPQAILNWRRKSVQGLSMDFIHFNVLGFTCYSRDQGQTVSTFARIYISSAIIIALVHAVRASIGAADWIDVLYDLSIVKLIISFIKYCPQVYINWFSQSTVGWSIHNILLDFTGGVLSLAQLVLDAYISGDWSGISGDPIKLGLGFLSISFDLVFMIQHYVLYRDRTDFYASEQIMEHDANERQGLLLSGRRKYHPPPIKEEVPYDPRTLYERLQEQKQKKQDAFAEATKFGNLIHRIDNDEFDFLNTLESDEVKKRKELAEQEEEELKKFRMNVQLKSAPLPSQPLLSSGNITKQEPASASATATTTAWASKPKKKSSLFAGLVKRDDSPSSSSKPNPTTTPANQSQGKDDSNDAKTVEKRKAEETVGATAGKASETDAKKPKVDVSPATTISKPNALLSLVAYDSSSDDDEDDQ